MMRALNEVGTMVRNAAIGANIPIGQADDLARTATYLAGHGQDLDCIVAALTEPQTPIDVAWGGDRVVIKAGNAAVAAPIVKDSFTTGGVKARLCNADHIPLVTAMLAEVGVQVTVKDTVIRKKGFAATTPIVGPVDIPQDIWRTLTQLAAMTYVPATDASRKDGAGEGPSDDD